MIITYHGNQHVKLGLGDLTIAYNPVAKNASGKSTKYGANIAISSLHTPEYSGVSEVTHGNKEPFTVTGPGEYETQGIFIKGVGTEVKTKKGTQINTIYTFTLDNMSICFLGSLSKKLSAKERESIDDVDIVFVGEGVGVENLNVFELYQIAQSLSPKIIIPVGFNETSLPLFLRESGKDTREYVEKLTIKRKDIESKNGEVVPLMEV
jgi:L-ascorbate metabolism protein UlaG (beta-lactamase superfamily)